MRRRRVMRKRRRARKPGNKLREEKKTKRLLNNESVILREDYDSFEHYLMLFFSYLSSVSIHFAFSFLLCFALLFPLSFVFCMYKKFSENHFSNDELFLESKEGWCRRSNRSHWNGPSQAALLNYCFTELTSKMIENLQTRKENTKRNNNYTY
jgi:hypothetical protein